MSQSGHCAGSAGAGAARRGGQRAGWQCGSWANLLGSRARSVEDDGDGDGVPEALLSRIARRGVRFDDTLDGTGLGLSLAHDIVEAVGGEMRLENLSPGFRVTFRLKAAA